MYLPSCAIESNARDKGIVEIGNVDEEIVPDDHRQHGTSNHRCLKLTSPSLSPSTHTANTPQDITAATAYTPSNTRTQR